jgi:hypothetical protein
MNTKRNKTKKRKKKKKKTIFDKFMFFQKKLLTMSVEFICTLTLPTNGPKTKEIPPFCQKE